MQRPHPNGLARNRTQEQYNPLLEQADRPVERAEESGPLTATHDLFKRSKHAEYSALLHKKLGKDQITMMFRYLVFYAFDRI